LAAGLVTILAAAVLAPHALVLLSRLTNGTAIVTYSDGVPSPKLKWDNCYKANFLCSFLTVPLDYNDTSAGTTDGMFVKVLEEHSSLSDPRGDLKHLRSTAGGFCQAKAARGSLSSHLPRYPIEASAHIVDRSFTEAPKYDDDSPHFLVSPYSAY
jgi:hypothetical protein